MINKVLIMAAGRGERLKPITDFQPKPLTQITEENRLIDYSLETFENMKEIYVTVGYKSKQLTNYVLEHGVDAVFDTTGADNSWWVFNSLLKYVDEPIFVTTSDIIVDIDLDKVIENYKKLLQPACMLIPIPSNNNGSGDYIIGENNKVTNISRDKKSNFYASGIQIIKPRVVNNLVKKANSFKDVWDQLIDKNELYYSNVKPNSWYCVDTIKDLERVRGILK